MSMAACEYVSVSSQSDTETADLTREAQEIADTTSPTPNIQSWPAYALDGASIMIWLTKCRGS